MGRYYSSKKEKADFLNKVRIYWLKEHGYLNGYSYGGIEWTSWSESKSSINIQSSVRSDDKYIRFIYTQTDKNNGEKKDFDYKIPLATTPCQYGGSRYWFICPWYKNGVYCGRRVGILYKGGDYFACRHCYNLSYASRNLSPSEKPFGKMISIPELERLEQSIKRTHYGGQETKKYKRYLKKEIKAHTAMIGAILSLERRYNKWRR